MVILFSMHIEIFVFFYITIYNECKCTYNIYIYIYNIFVRCIILIDVDIFHELDIPWYFGQLMLRFIAND